MANIDYRKVIDEDLKWNPTLEEIRLSAAVKRAEKKMGPKWTSLVERLMKVKTEPPILKVGLYHPVFYAFQARAEWEILNLAEELGYNLRDEYNLHRSGQGGVAVDWDKLGQRIWVPADYTEIKRETAAIFSHDETNCIGVLGAYVTPETDALREKVIYGPDKRGSSEAKIEALLTNAEWRQSARDYSLRLLNCAATRYRAHVKEGYLPVLDALVSAYAGEMR